MFRGIRSILEACEGLFNSFFSVFGGPERIPRRKFKPVRFKEYVKRHQGSSMDIEWKPVKNKKRR